MKCDILSVAVAWPRPRRERWELGRRCPDQQPDLSDGLLFLEEEGFRVVIEDSSGFPLNPLARMHEFYSGLDPLRAARALCRSRRYDALLSIGCSSAFFLVQLRKALGLRIPIVLIDPALSRDYPRRKRLQDIVLPLVDKVVVYGNAQLEYLSGEYGDRVDAALLPHRVDTEFYDPCAVGPVEDGGNPLILSVGNDISRDFDTLVDAMAIGDLAGDLGARCLIHSVRPIKPRGTGIEQHQDRIPFVDLRRLYGRASVFVLPLKETIHPGGITSLLEAMAMARPVVASRSPGILDYVVHGDTALIVDPGDAAGMAAAIRRLLGDPAESRRLGENARRAVLEKNRNRRYAEILARLLRDVIRRGGPRPVHCTMPAGTIASDGQLSSGTRS